MLYSGFKKYKRDKSYWQELKNKYEGNRGFVIGNGPSLKIGDLTKLQNEGEITIASNKIFLAFDQTPWRPSIFTIADGLVWDKIAHQIHEDIEVVHTRYDLDYKKSNVPVRVWRRLKDTYRKLNEVKFSDNLIQGMHPGGTVTFENLQIAIYLGLNPIYIIGCDHYYGGEDDEKGTTISHKKGIENHFIKGYRKPGEKAGKANLGFMNASYLSVKAYADLKGIKVFNATRGGYLEVFERTIFDDLFH
ncbi:MAG: 6-hydroxymethylpterin diphosphokinase MptE-like protein [Bacteroidota bacterium]